MKRHWVVVLTVVIAFLTASPSVQAQRNNTPRTKTWGPTFITSPVFLHGFGDIHIGNRDFTNKISIAGVSQFVGYQFSPIVIVGLGAGFEYWTNCRNAFVPIYADLRINMGKGPLAPQWYLNVGFANRWYFNSTPYVSDKQGNSSTYLIHGDRSGIMAETGLGIKAQISDNAAIILSGVVKFQETSVKYYAGEEELTNMKPLLVNTSEHNWYTFAGIRAGIVF